MQYQEHLLLGVFNQRLKKIDQLIRIERLANDHPVLTTLDGHCGNLR